MKAFYALGKFFLTVAIIGIGIFYFRSDLNLAWKSLEKKAWPCAEPIAYSIGDFDKRFNLSPEDFKEAISRAAAIWNGGAKKPLFTYAEAGSLKINLLYDARQDATLKLQSLGIDIHKDQASYENLKTKYKFLNQTYERQKAELDGKIAYYNEQKESYEDLVKAANRRGGATPDEFAILENERQNLNSLANDIKSREEKINKTVDELNALATTINRLAYELNLNVDNYNTIGSKTAGEFQEGVYISDKNGERINIYQFDNQEMLISVLAHELGHALGLEHLDDKEAIMYRLNEAGKNRLSEPDLTELKRVCRIK